jgi:hypothetical protein
VTALLLIVAVLLFLAFRADPSPDDWVSNARVGVAAASFFVLVLGMIIFPSGPFIRPHPVVWRLAFGVAVLYEIWLILLLFQTKEHARLSMKFFDQSLGVPVSERSYAADCSFNWVSKIDRRSSSGSNPLRLRCRALCTACSLSPFYLSMLVCFFSENCDRRHGHLRGEPFRWLDRQGTHHSVRDATISVRRPARPSLSLPPSVLTGPLFSSACLCSPFVPVTCLSAG